MQKEYIALRILLIILEGAFLIYIILSLRENENACGLFSKITSRFKSKKIQYTKRITLAEDDLETLKDKFDDDLITLEEYEKKKAEIISKL